VHTGFLTQHAETLAARDPEAHTRLWLLACCGRLEARRLRAPTQVSPWADTRAFRNSGPHADVLSFVHAGETLRFEVTFAEGAVTIGLPTRTVVVREARLEGTRLCCEVDGQRLCAVYVEDGSRSFVFTSEDALEAAFVPSPLALADDDAASNVVRAPMSGKIHAVLVKEGDRVERGQVLLSLEAMKMEHTLRAATAGAVATLHTQVGEQVEEGRTLLVLRGSEDG